MGDGSDSDFEVHDDATGTIASKALNPANARVLLKLGLTVSSDPRMIPDLFNAC